MNKKIYLILVFICFFSFFLNFFKQDAIPACLNADEAAFGYNTYSVAQTGKDEYGNTAPLRFKSFGDYKMPLYAYLSVPTVHLFGLNESSTRALNSGIALLFPLIVFLLAYEIFRKVSISLISAFLTAASLGLHIVGRQAHEAYITAFFISLATYFYVKIMKDRNNVPAVLFFLLSLLVALFGYQSSRIFAVFFFLIAIFHALRGKIKSFVVVGIVVVIALFGITDLMYKPDRVTNLLFFNTRGFSDKISEFRNEGGGRIIYNKATIATQTVLNEHIKYYSPQFLLIDGDTNRRFGFPNLPIITYIEYISIIVGFYYLFKNKHSFRHFLLLLILIAPLAGSPTKVDTSLTRALFLLVPLILAASYGIVALLSSMNKKYFSLVVFIFITLELGLLVYSWDFYFNHYPKRAVMVREWQCGYKELATYVKDNYEKFDKFYITQRNGQPYIFLLYYLKYPPEKYHTQANLSAPDQYGFGQIKYFDKFIFDFPKSKNQPRAAVIGYPDQFTELKDKTLNIEHVKKIKIGSEVVFWIYENPI